LKKAILLFVFVYSIESRNVEQLKEISLKISMQNFSFLLLKFLISFLHFFLAVTLRFSKILGQKAGCSLAVKDSFLYLLCSTRFNPT